MHIFTKMGGGTATGDYNMEKNYLQSLNKFDTAVRSWEINPGFGMNVDEIKRTYSEYIFAKGKTKLSEELQSRENDLVRRCGGLLG